VTHQRALQMQRAAARLCTLHTRVLCELLTEIGRVHDIEDDVLQRAEKFSQVDPDLLRALGGDQFPPRIRRVV
jgi:hypothetical protein